MCTSRYQNAKQQYKASYTFFGNYANFKYIGSRAVSKNSEEP